ncbi:MAG: 50S ribosomal protein L22 [Chlorobi bacterium]|nr:50S ribosomal protein L22 [Chlorobiota bacterium]
MGRRKREMAQRLKEEKRSKVTASLRNHRISARKTRLVADLVRGKEVNKALAILKFTPNASAAYIEKLLVSAINNWEQKNPDKALDDVTLYIKSIQVGEAGMLKRIQPAPQGRAHRIRKRMSHITLELGEKINN